MGYSMDVEILDDGTISVKTGDIGQTNHFQADEIIEELEKETGGKHLSRKREHTFWKNKRVQRGGKIVPAR